MAEIKAFRGMRYNTQTAGKISELCCPPYDIISEKQRLEYIKANAHNIIRLELPREGENPYAAARETLDKWRRSSVLTLENKPAIYAYEEEFDCGSERKKIKGIIARVHLEEFEKGIILPHEFTLSKAKEDRLNLMKATNCNFSQIYALYSDDSHTTIGKVDEHTQSSPELEFTDGDGVTHRLWVITDKAVINKLCADFTDRKLYIADGHHRYETALNYRNYLRENGLAKEGDGCDSIMMFLADMEHPGLEVFPTHRLVRNLPDFSVQKVLDGCKKLFDIEKLFDTSCVEAELAQSYDEHKRAFAFYAGGNVWYRLTLKDESVMDGLLPNLSKASRRLDVNVLHTPVLENVLGIDKENMARQINLTYTKSLDEAINGVDCGEFQCAFLMNPTRVSEIKDVALADEKMPQKSTYFYPKMITGLVMNDLEVNDEC